MLAYILALAVGLGSLGIFLAAFFLPELHRKNDILWSGVGLFYALVLWVCAGRITGGVLLGQLASVAMLGWAVSQTLSLRRELTPAGQKTPIPESLQGGSLGSRLQGFIGGVTSKLSGGKTAPSTPVPPPAPPVETPVAAVAETIVITPQTPETVEIPAEAASPAPEVTETSSVEVDTSTVGELVEVTEDVTIAEVVAEVLPGMDGEASSGSIELDVAANSPEETIAETPEASHSEEPVPPHPPSPELVEAAVADAEEKHLPSDPPPTTDEVEKGTDSSSDTDDDDWV